MDGNLATLFGDPEEKDLLIHNIKMLNKSQEEVIQAEKRRTEFLEYMIKHPLPTQNQTYGIIFQPEWVEKIANERKTKSLEIILPAINNGTNRLFVQSTKDIMFLEKYYNEIPQEINKIPLKFEKGSKKNFNLAISTINQINSMHGNSNAFVMVGFPENYTNTSIAKEISKQFSIDLIEWYDQNLKLTKFYINGSTINLTK